VGGAERGAVAVKGSPWRYTGTREMLLNCLAGMQNNRDTDSFVVDFHHGLLVLKPALGFTCPCPKSITS
jgi:hypothetical protein